MNTEWTSALSRAVHEVFESLCFMLPAPGGTTRPAAMAATADAGAPRILLEVDFSGAQTGVLRLALPDAMIAPVASAMLGEDGPLSLDEQYEAVCELANVVCGNVLPLIAGERAVFDLSSPRVIATTDTDVASTFDAVVEVLLEEGSVGASIALRSQSQIGTS